MLPDADSVTTSIELQSSVVLVLILVCSLPTVPMRLLETTDSLAMRSTRLAQSAQKTRKKLSGCVLR